MGLGLAVKYDAVFQKGEIWKTSKNHWKDGAPL